MVGRPLSEFLFVLVGRPADLITALVSDVEQLPVKSKFFLSAVNQSADDAIAVDIAELAIGDLDWLGSLDRVPAARPAGLALDPDRMAFRTGREPAAMGLSLPDRSASLTAFVSVSSVQEISSSGKPC